MNASTTLPISPSDRIAIERALAPLLAHARLRLFGSRARGDARHTSDIDLAVQAGARIPAAELAALREALEESHVPFRVDLVDYATASPQLKQAIDREGIPWPA